MNKNIILGILAVVLVVLGIWALKNNSNSDSNKAPKIEIDHTTSRPDLSDATFIFDDQAITFKDNLAEIKVSPDSETIESTSITNNIAYGDLNNDGKEDATVLFVQSGAGTGIFVYVGAYVSGTVRYNGSNAIFIGDRISPQSISIDNKVITVRYLDRKEDEPFSATPTIPKSKSFVFVNGELKELK